MKSLFSILPSSFSTRSRGFTLVEIIVALAIFCVVAVVALGALLKIINANKKAQTIHDSITNLSFALDTMARELRVGSNYTCTNSSFSSNTLSGTTPCSGISSGDGSIAFYSSNVDPNNTSCNLIYAYKFTSTDTEYPGQIKLEKAQQTACGQSIGGSGQKYYPIISPNVTITNYYLKVSTNSSGPYPLAFVRIVGYAGTSDVTKTYFDVQTAVSPQVP